MPGLRIELLGGFSVRDSSGKLVEIPTQKARALLAFLAVAPGRFHSREKLTALLWGDTQEDRARASFRQALASVRRALGADAATALLTREDALAVSADGVSVDVAEFEVAVRATTPAELERAAGLYAGDLLEGVAVREPPFEEWRTLERERLRELALGRLARLLRDQMDTGQPEPALQTALQMLRMDPLQEAAHRAAMRLYVRQGRRAAALRQYQDCVRCLERELGAEPEEETRALYRDILRGAAGAGPAVRGAQDAAPRGAATTPGPLVGREREAAALRGALSRAVDVGASVVMLVGEAGIGKTRLIQELVVDASGRARFFSAACHATEQALPFRPWVDALRGEAGLDPDLLARLAPSTRRMLARVFPELAEGPSEAATANDHALLFEAMAELIRLLGESGPMVIALEDLHWADAVSARFLAFLGRRLGARPVLIVGTARPEDTAEAPALEQAMGELRAEGRLQEIALRPLTKEETLDLARALRGSELTDTLAADLWALSEGNPFVIVEAIRGLVAEGPADRVRRVRLSSTIREAVSGRLARLTEVSRRALGAAAVIGRSFTFALFQAVAALDDAEAAKTLEELVRRRILESSGERLDFYHDRVRQVAYEDLLAPRRTSLHRAAALALETIHRDDLDEAADQIGHHFLRAGDGARAYGYLVRFGDIATRRYALDAALGALSQAESAIDGLPAAERDQARLDVVLRQAHVHSVAGRQRKCLELLEAHTSLPRRVDDPALASEYDFRLAMTYAYHGDSARSVLAGESALRRAELMGDADRIGKAHYALAAGYYGGGFAREAIAHDLEAAPLLERTGNGYWLGLVYFNLAANQLGTGQLGAALETIRRCEAVADAAADRRLGSLACYIRAVVLADCGEDVAALASAERAVELSPNQVTTTTALLSLGYARWRRGEAAPAAEALEGALQSVQAAPVRRSHTAILVCLAEVALQRGDLEAAANFAARAVEVNGPEGNRLGLGLAEHTAARVALARGDRPGAERRLIQALDSFAACGAAFEAAMTRLDLARTLAARGARAEAIAQVEQATRAFEVAEAPRRAAEARALARELSGGTL